MTAYPDEHPVFLVHSAGTDAEIVEELPCMKLTKPAYPAAQLVIRSAASPQASFEAFQR